jgi:small subunit ribosomal protein S3Ae
VSGSLCELSNTSSRTLSKLSPFRRIPNQIGEAIKKGTGSIFPIRDCMIRKVKMLKKPKFDIVKLMELHGDVAGEDTGKALGRDQPTVETLKGSGGRL